jgi:signal transduction histidine kinase
MALRSLTSGQLGRVPAVDLLLAGGLVAGVLVQVALDASYRADGLPVAFSLVGCALAAARRAAPLGAAAAFALLVVAQELAHGEVAANPVALFVATLVVVYSVGAHAEGRRSIAGLACLLGAELLTAVVEGFGPTSDWVSGMVANLALWLVGVSVRRGRGRIRGLERHLVSVERETDRREREAVEVERGRIARELHDVIAHSVALMTVQAGAGETVLDQDPDRARAALRAVQETGQRTVEDLRRLLGLLRTIDSADATPEPSLGGLPALAERITAAGLPVDLEVRGEPAAVSPGLDATAYRIVQEALTNALRHAAAERATVLVAYEPPVLRLVVEDDGTGPTSRSSGGHGLVGMRERAAVFGGELEAGPRAPRGFKVSVRLPLNGAPR